MKNTDRVDVERSLTELSDKEAIAIMEGRLAGDDTSETADAARRFAIGVLTDSEQQTSTPSGGAHVIELVVRQPWMRMAAAVALGVLVGALVRAPDQFVDSSPTTGVASANVVYLETTRGPGSGEVPRVQIVDNEPWITLVVYPDFQGAKLLRLQVEREVVQDGQSAANVRSDDWEPVVDVTTGPGTQDSVAATIAADLLKPGYHRLKIIADKGNGQSFETAFPFMVVR